MTGRKNGGTPDRQVGIGQVELVEQLDLFGETPKTPAASTPTQAHATATATRTVRDAARQAAREWEAHLAEERTAARASRAELAPRLYAPTDARGYWARVLAFDAWVAEYGNFNCHARSHGWHREIAHHDPDAPTADCRPTTLAADLRCKHYRDECFCVTDLLHRAACLSCDWEGPTRDQENPAVEDAHDHAWPGWRDLPCVTTPPERGTSAQHKKRAASWEADVNDAYPAGWLAAGGPIRTMRNSGETRHVPGRTGHGGYDLSAGITPRPLGGLG